LSSRALESDAGPAASRTVSRTALNFWINLATLAAFCVLLGSSMIMKWILPPGTCDEAGVKVWLGHSRHWWGDIHFWAAMLMLILIIVHLWLHWGWVLSTWQRFLGGLRAARSWAALLTLAGVIAVPWVIPAYYLEVETEQAVVAADGAAADASGESAAATVAPCGIEGLSCADCPAADDRLFGGGCAGGDDEQEPAEDGAANEDTGEDATADAETAAACEDGDCASCPFAADCADD